MGIFGRSKLDKAMLAIAELQESNAILLAAHDVPTDIVRSPTPYGTPSGGVSGSYPNDDTLKNIYKEFGYPLNLEFSNFWNMYRRFGIAKRGCDLPVTVGWSTDPEIESPNRQFNNELEALNSSVKLWNRLQALDMFQRVGQYSGLFIRVKDGKNPKEPIDTRLSGPASVQSLTPLYEGQLYIKEVNRDPIDPDYGMPTMYEYRGGVIGNRQTKVSDTFDIHPDRVVLTSETALNGGVWGVSALEAPYNGLMDMRKVIGSSGEGFYKNAAQNLGISSGTDSDYAIDESDMDALDQQVQDFNNNRMRKHLIAAGFDIQALNTIMASPEHPFNVALNDAAAGFGIAATILIGQQTGRLASTEDTDNFLSGVKARQGEYQTELIDKFLEWCMTHGVLPVAKYEITWEDLLARSDADLLDLGDKMAAINEKQFRSGQGGVYTSEEIREATGYDADELDLGDLGETELDDISPDAPVATDGGLDDD